jgi:hypothetical protein
MSYFNVTIYRNALKSSNLMGGRPLYISVRGGGTPPPLDHLT